jgi:NitT/TauT family transport system permease protein
MNPNPHSLLTGAATARPLHPVTPRWLSYPAWLPGLTVAVVALSLWSLATWLALVPDYSLPSPRAVAAGWLADLHSGRLLTDVVVSLYRVTCGFLLAVALGVPTGLWLGQHRLAQAGLLPAVNFFRSLSPLAWIPFAILWFGIGDAPAIFLIFMATFFPLVLSVLGAVANIPLVYRRVAQEYGFSGPGLLFHITLPAILPQLITSLRVIAGLAWLVVVAAEMIAGRDGLGFAIWDARNGLRSDLLISRMITIGLLGVLIDGLLRQLTRLPNVRWGYGE